MNLVNLNGASMGKTDSVINCKLNGLEEEFNNFIWTVKAIDYMNEENQENLSRVHVLCCSQCDFLTISLKALQQHMTVQHSIPGDDFNNLTIYCCQQCKCVSTELKLIQEHIKIFHKISGENSSISEKIVNNKIAVLTPTLSKNCRKPNHLKLVKTQLKMRKKLLQRKLLKSKICNNFLSSDMDTEDNNNNNNDCPTINHEVKSETSSHLCNEIDVSQDIDPLDMSINSTTCPFKGIKNEPADNHDYQCVWKQEPVFNDQFDGSLSNLVTNNPLLSNPQTCIELIKLTLGQMLAKSNEQNRLTQLGFNSQNFLQTQFQLAPSLVPLLLPNVSQNHSPKNLEIETMIANMQQQNLLKAVSSPKSFDQNGPMLSYQQSPLYLNHKMAGSPSNLNPALFLDNNQKNGNSSCISPLYNVKKPMDNNHKTSAKRNLKKQCIPTKVQHNINDEATFLPTNLKFESPKPDLPMNENLFNRSFLDTSEVEGPSEHVDLSKVLDPQDGADPHSNKSSPNTNDKPHRQNFTSQQNRILSDWFSVHRDKPYPSTEDTKELSQISGLSYSQVKKWFANKRARSSLNKKNHKSYSLVNPNDDMLNQDQNSVSPSSESHRSYTNHIDATTAIDFTTFSQELSERQES